MQDLLPSQINVIWAATWQNQQNGCASSEDSDHPGHPPSLIRVFAVRMKKPWVLSYPLSALRRLWSDWADAQSDLSLHWAHTYFVVLSCRGSVSVLQWKSSFSAYTDNKFKKRKKTTEIYNLRNCSVPFNLNFVLMDILRESHEKIHQVL